jgi:hypothetical protein
MKKQMKTILTEKKKKPGKRRKNEGKKTAD